MSGKREGFVRIFGKVSLHGFCSRCCASWLPMTLHVNARWWGDQAHQVVMASEGRVAADALTVRCMCKMENENPVRIAGESV